MRQTFCNMYRITSWCHCWTRTSLPPVWCSSWSCKSECLATARLFNRSECFRLFFSSFWRECPLGLVWTKLDGCYFLIVSISTLLSLNVFLMFTLCQAFSTTRTSKAKQLFHNVNMWHHLFTMNELQSLKCIFTDVCNSGSTEQVIQPQSAEIETCLCFHVSLEDGRLLDYLVAHDELMEEKVAFFIRETLEALEHLHTCRVAHLDLKVTAGFCLTYE